MRDPVFPFKLYKQIWQPLFPDAPVLQLDRASHFLQEDAHELIVPNLLKFLDGQRVASTASDAQPRV